MMKSDSIMRNLLKNNTYRTIASILIYTRPRFPVNLVVNSTIAGT